MDVRNSRKRGSAFFLAPFIFRFPALFALLFDGVAAFLDVAADFLRLAAKIPRASGRCCFRRCERPTSSAGSCLLSYPRAQSQLRIGPDSPHPFPDSSRFVPPLRPV